MRVGVRQRRREEEEESVFVSMTDMTVSFLFILMILLAFFASRFRPDETVPRWELEEARQELAVARAELDRLRPLAVEAEALRAEVVRLERLVAELERELAELRRPDALEVYLREVAASRRIALERLRDAIRAEFDDLKVEITEESDALRFQGDGLFPTGRSTLKAGKQPVVERIAELLDEILPCYSLGSRTGYDASCNPGFAVIEAVQIEGHTDAQGGDLYNVNLSADRAVVTYGVMTGHVPGLLDHLNLSREPVMSIAGYGENRPVVGNDTEAGRATNRRIDLRFIMFTPSRGEEIEGIKARLSAGAAEAGR